MDLKKVSKVITLKNWHFLNTHECMWKVRPKDPCNTVIGMEQGSKE